MRTFRHLAIALLSAAAALLLIMGLMLVMAAFRGDPPAEAGPGVYLGVSALFIATALLLAWGAWAIWRKIRREA
jgi:hypothetical protein